MNKKKKKDLIEARARSIANNIIVDIQCRFGVEFGEGFTDPEYVEDLYTTLILQAMVIE